MPQSKKATHKHEGCANVHEAFRTFIGCTVTGCLFDAMPGHLLGTKTLIFDCGWGLTIASNGSYWPEAPAEIERAIGIAKDRLETAERELRGVVSLAGA